MDMTKPLRLIEQGNSIFQKINVSEWFRLKVPMISYKIY